jgi:hypothetical protein
MEHSANIMRIALIVSIIGHVLFVTLSVRDLRPTAHGETMDVEIVAANEVPSATGGPKANDPLSSSKAEQPEPKADEAKSEPPAPKSNPSQPHTKTAQPKPEPKAAPSKTTEHKQQPPIEQKPPQPMEAAAQPQAPLSTPAASTTLEDLNRASAMLGLPFNYDTRPGTSAEPMVKVAEGVKEFKAQVRRCFKLPAGINATDRFSMLILIPLKPNGALDGEPLFMGGKDAPLGPALKDSALRAVRQCAPYNLPADKYKDWKELYIDFSPDQMLGS